MNRTTRLLLAAMLLPLYAVANEAIRMNIYLENIASEYATCAAYYRIVYKGAIASNWNDIASEYRKLEDDAMFYSLLLASESRGQDLAVQVTNARIESSVKVMKKVMDNRNENIAILINKYGHTCVALSEEPSAAVQSALNQALSGSN